MFVTTHATQLFYLAKARAAREAEDHISWQHPPLYALLQQMSIRQKREN
jgi:hypothetical protein